MSKVKNVVVKGDYGFVESTVGVYTFEFTGQSTYKVAQPGVLPFYNKSRAQQPLKVGEFQIIPYGEQNNYPDELRVILDENNLTPEIINKQVQLLWGQGPKLYSENFDQDGKRRKIWCRDPQIESWFKSWDFEDYLMKTVVEFRTINGHFTKYYRNKGVRIGEKGFIHHLENVSSRIARLEWPDDNDNINHVITGEWDQPWRKGLTGYPIFNRFNPFVNPVSMRYTNLYGFALDGSYSLSPFHGSLSWIKLQSSIPVLLSNFNLNSATIKYHIKVPAIYWAQKREKLMSNCKLQNKEYNEKMMDDLKVETLRKFVDVLSGKDNVGKFIQTDEIWHEEAKSFIGWKVDVLDQKVKDYIDAQINISKRAALETSAGHGLHSALSNISYEGNLPSGSEQLYAFKLYLMTGVDIPEMLVCKDINDAISINFPEKDIKLGFYHDTVVTEEATKPKDRVKNN